MAELSGRVAQLGLRCELGAAGDGDAIRILREENEGLRQRLALVKEDDTGCTDERTLRYGDMLLELQARAGDLSRDNQNLRAQLDAAKEYSIRME